MVTPDVSFPFCTGGLAKSPFCRSHFCFYFTRTAVFISHALLFLFHTRHVGCGQRLGLRLQKGRL